MLKGKKILLGVTGSIAAYKAAFLTRLLVKEKAEVKIVLTQAAKEFITPLTLSTLSNNIVYSEFVSDTKTGEWSNHVELGLWADAMLIAPVTANTIAKMATGQCDNFLLAVYLSARCPVFYAPAMDLDMFKHKSTQQNIKVLEKYGNIQIAPETGELASGLVGEGRMAEPENILEQLNKFFSTNLPLKEKKILITAGPTYEAIDPVRFVGNHSSGKMGFALAEQAAQLGAEVHLVTGPTNLQVESNNITRTDVISAKEMYNACIKKFTNCDIAIMAAAVSDYTPKESAKHKIKKESSSSMELEMKETSDILKELGKRKKKQLLVGFALETNDEIKNAKKKLAAKNLDFIVLNSLNDKGAGFQKDTNKISIIDRKNKISKYKTKSKIDVASDIFLKIIEEINA
jgi:phosphopantothenoylcysteine decarboxylase / phosphopantothenate---cysteine ligase